jgi:hypothetical protein
VDAKKDAKWRVYDPRCEVKDAHFKGGARSNEGGEKADPFFWRTR